MDLSEPIFGVAELEPLCQFRRSTMIHLLKPESTRELLGKKKTQFHADINNGLFVRPIAVGVRARAFASNEVEALIKARIAGKSDDEIRTLVNTLHAARRELA